MFEFAVLIRPVTQFDSLAAACDKAQQIADKENEAGVWQLVKVFKPEPEPKMVTQDIDAMLEALKGNNLHYMWALANALKQMGVTKLEWPESAQY